MTSRSALEGERKLVSVLFVDVKGSVALADEIGAEALHGIMDRFFRILSEGIHQFQGTINQFTGDGIMALFGAPVAHEDHGRRACYAALYLNEKMRRYSAELKQTKTVTFSVRMGINSGEVVVGRIGDDLRMDYTALGHTVGLASRMEQLAAPGCIYLSQSTATLVKGFFHLEDLGAFEIKGLQEPVHVFHLQDIGPLRTRLDRSHARGLTPFAGRKDEMRILEAALERASQGNGQVLGIIAEAGVGKSRLSLEFVRRCRDRGISVRETQAVAHGQRVPFLPTKVMLRSLLEIKLEDRQIESRQRIESTLMALDPNLAEGLPMLFEFLELGISNDTPETLDPEMHQSKLLAYIVRVLHAAGQGRTCVFVLEDLQWFDPSSDLFLEEFIDSIGGTKTLLLVNFRPDYHASWMNSACYQQLPLHMLDESSIKAMILQLLGDHPSVSDLTRAIYDRCDGNPFFVEEVVYSLVDQGVLIGERQHYQLTAPIPELAVPATVQAVLEARIDRLPDREKQLLQTVAVIGGRFHLELVRDVLAEVPIEIGAALEHLVLLDFVFESARHPSAEYTFTHPLILEVAYHSQLNDSRAQIHRQVAEALEARSEADSDGRSVELAYHWEEAQVPMKAARWHARAGEGFGLRNAHAAEHHWRSVLEQIEETPECAEKARLGLAARIWLLRLLWRMGFGSDEVRQIFQEGLELAHRSQDDHGKAILMLCYANQCTAEGNYEDHRRHVEEACRLSGELHSPALERASRLALVNGLSVQGRLVAALAISEAEDTGAKWQQSSYSGRRAATHHAYSLASMAKLHSMTGQLHAAATELEHADAIARRLEEPETRGHLHNIRVHHALNLGDCRMALAHGIEATRLADETGMPRLRADAYASFGYAQILAEDWQGAVLSFDRAQDIVGDLEGLTSMLPRILLGVSQAQLGLGNFQEAIVTLEAILARPELVDTRILELSTHLTFARALLRAHGSDAADAIQKAICSALVLLEETGARALRPVVHHILAEVAQVIGDDATRRVQLETAQSLYREMGATGHAEALAPKISPDVAWQVPQ